VVFRITNRTDSTVRYRVGKKEFSLEPGYTVTHQRCRPPELALVPGEKGSEKAKKVYHPHPGDHDVLRKGREGGYAVQEE
jgi:hypothetical protein